MLEVEQLAVHYDETVALDHVNLAVADHEVVCVLGPSGSGKSTLLRAIAGLEPPDVGHVRWDGEDLTGVPPHRRHFGLMFQDHALFPHRDVLGNVAFGLRMQRLAGDVVDARARAALTRVGLAGFEHRRVRELSGGEQQRVALARALAPEPRLLMLDEPLGSLDRELRERLVAELRALFVTLSVTALFVTHDQDEAFALADRIVIMRAGTIEQVGTPQDVWRRPATEFAARFLGFANVVDATVDSEGIRSPWGLVPHSSGAPAAPTTGRVRLAARPDALRLDPNGPVPGRVVSTTFRRDHFLVQVDTALGILEVAAATPPTPGANVGLSLDAEAAVTLDRVVSVGMAALTFDHLYPYAELTDALHDLAAAHPELMELESAGQSHEGREIWLATITNRATGPHDEKPALFVEANIHATEITGSTAALHLIHHLVTGYGQDDAVTHALDTRVAYVIARLNPDGVEMALANPPTFLRSSTRIYPRPEQQPGLVEGDVDGDGRVLTMRVPDPNGSWKVHPDDARLLVPRSLDEIGPGPYYRLLPEGTVHEYDGVLIPIAPEHRSLDLNRNFPQEWLPEGDQHGSGPFPTSEPEVRALVEAVVARPNICAYIAYHTFSAVILRPYGGHADEHFPTVDLHAYQELGKRATEITGYETVSVFHDFKYDPKSSITGASDEWVYDYLGVFGWTTEFWSPIRAAGIKDYKYIDWFDRHPVEDDLKILAWNDDVLGGDGFVDWYPFDHPQLGRVEIGGWDFFRTWTNAPPALMEAEVAPHSEWAVAHLLASPRLSLRSFAAEPVGDGVYRVRLVVENTGWMPTNVTKKALDRKAIRPVEAERALPDGASIALGDERQEIGQLAGHGRARQMLAMFDGGFDPTDDRAKAEWVVRGAPGATVTVTARHARAGTIRAEITLP